MKKLKTYTLLFTLAVFLVPAFASAHAGEQTDFKGATPMQMMYYLEEQGVESETHEEMEALMEQMMEGALTEEGVTRLSVLMNEYPAVHGLMMHRLSWDSDDGSSFFGRGGMWGGHMMPYGGTGWSTLSGFTTIVWLIVGLLALLWLLKKFTKKE